MTLPIYASVVADHGWSPDDQPPPLDLESFIAASYGALSKAKPPPAKKTTRRPAKKTAQAHG